MSNQPNDLQKQLPRAGMIGGVLAVLAIGLFIALYIVLGNAGAEPAVRLLVSLCVPPAVLAIGFGLYILIARPKVE